MTDYPDDTLGARLLFYSGHGFHDGFIPFFKQDLSPVKKTVNNVLTYDLLRFDGSPTHTNNADTGYAYWWPCDHPKSTPHPNPYFEYVGDTLKPADWAVGAHWLTNSTTKTESRWNNNVKHIFFMACSLLNDQNGGTDPNGTPYKSSWSSAAVGWARTLLGDPGRAHQIAGYKWSAPGDGTDTNIANKFFDLSASGNTIFDAWWKANEANSATYWAFIDHFSSHSDKLPGWGTADPPDATAVNIDYYWHNTSTTTNKKDLTLSMPNDRYSNEKKENKGFFAKILASVTSFINENKFDYYVAQIANLFNETPAFAEGNNETNSLYKITAQVPNNEPELEELITSIELVNEGQVISNIFGNEKPKEKQDNSNKEFTNENKVLKLYKSGAIEFDNGKLDDQSLRISEAEAIEMATKKLEGNGGLPKDAGKPKVSKIMRSHLNIEKDQFENEETMAYVIEWDRKIDGVAVGGYDKVKVVVDNNGVNTLSKQWKPVISKGKKVKFIPAETVLEKVNSMVNLGIPFGSTITAIEPAYFTPGFESTENVFKPVWKISFNNGEAERYFDAVTGELVY